MIKKLILTALLAAALTATVASCGKAADEKIGQTSNTTGGESMANETTRTEGGRSYPRFDIAEREDIVAICYSTWFNPVIDANGSSEPPNITKILAGERDWGGLYAFHYWAEPALGYYRSDDRAAIRQHMLWLGEAGVDFIIIDNTNASPGWKDTASPGSAESYWTTMVSRPTAALLETIIEMRAEGIDTPYVAMWCNNGGGWGTVDAVIDEFYSDEKYSDIWVYWDGKPFFITTSKPASREDITVRMMWGLNKKLAASEWSFLNVPNVVSYDKDGNAEQVGVCTAAQETYMSVSTAHGREGGLTFYRSWLTAFEARPKIVTITWWNEWVAQRFEDDNGTYGPKGNSLFVDNYSEEYSRDIEPMKDGHGDAYYKWMCEYIAAYKAHEECPRLTDGN